MRYFLSLSFYPLKFGTVLSLLVSLAVATGQGDHVHPTDRGGVSFDPSSPLTDFPISALFDEPAFPLHDEPRAPATILESFTNNAHVQHQQALTPARDRSYPPVVDLDASSSGEPDPPLPHPSLSQGRKRKSPPSNRHPSFEPQSVDVPRLEEADVPETELWHLWRTMRYKLDRLRINPATLKIARPLSNVNLIHLDLLRNQLQRQFNLKRVIFVTPTADHKARIFAIPILNDRFKTLVLDKEPGKKLGWAFVAIRSGPHPAASLYSYALLDVPDVKDFEAILETGKRVRALSKYLTPTV